MRRLGSALAVVAVFAAGVLLHAWLASQVAAHRITGGEAGIECIGRGSTHVVYLHGIDSLGPSWQELENRQTIARLAEELDLAVAVPRASRPCPSPSSRCWADDTLSAIRTAARHCFGTPATVGAVAFSNGAFALGAAYQRCQATELAWVALGGGGAVGDGIAADLTGCGRIAIAMGTNDRHHRHFATDFVAALRARHARVELVEFDGGHRFDYAAMHAVLASLVGKR